MKKMKQVLAILLAVAMLVCAVPMLYSAEAVTTNELASYVQGLIGTSAKEWGSGSGTQCVELPKYYLDNCFGLSTKSIAMGNGNEFYKNVASKYSDKFQRIDYYNGFVPMPGDIISFHSSTSPNEGHAAIVYSVSGNQYSIAEQWKGSGTVRSNTKTVAAGVYGTSYTIIGVARPYCKAETAPTWASLSINKEEILATEDFTFSMSANTSVDYFWFTICRASNNEVILSESTNGTFTTSFLSCDHYYAWCSAANSKGSVDSNRIDFYVYGAPPTEGSMNASKDTINLGDSLSFHFFSNAYYTRNYVAIFAPNGTKCLEGWKEDGFSFTPTVPGVYNAYASLHTVDGGIDTPWIRFTVLCSKHLWNKGVDTKSPTCLETGVRTFTCTVCGAAKTETIEKAAHTTTTINAKDATYDADGYTGDTYCTVCKQTLSYGSVIPKLAKPDEPTNPTNPTNPTQPTNPAPQPTQPQQSGGSCRYCGGTHTGFPGILIGFFHSILALFGLRK